MPVIVEVIITVAQDNTLVVVAEVMEVLEVPVHHIQSTHTAEVEVEADMVELEAKEDMDQVTAIQEQAMLVEVEAVQFQVILPLVEPEQKESS